MRHRRRQVLHDFLSSVCRDGIAFVSGVTTKVDASNMAYASNKELPFHTDFPSLNDPPQLQMLHMLQRADEGGLNLFVDGFHVAEQLRINHRKYFDLLTRVKMEYIEQGYDVHEGSDGKPYTFYYDMAAQHRVIRTDMDGNVIRIQFGNAMRSWFYECDVSEIQEVYRAMKLFTDYCYRPENILKIQMENVSLTYRLAFCLPPMGANIDKKIASSIGSNPDNDNAIYPAFLNNSMV
uniref:TauD/TfdA-like domain-containing protein n=1 Tax=Parascaris equorum TaxID=6256 RepID=A0A914RW94_PAREQ